jgi:SAM-dependent methyltransferase
MASQDRFGYKWKQHPEIFPEQHRVQFEKWIFPLKAKDFKGKKVLDLGCGIGRNAYFFLKEGANVTAFDYDRRTLEACRKNLEGFKNKEIIYMSAYDMGWKDKFDLSFAIGVIHHLGNQPLAVKKMAEATKKGGKVLVWLYGRENNWWIVYIISPIRFFTSRLPLPVTNIISYFFSVPLFLYTHIIPQGSPYMRQLGTFKFRHIHEIVFDHLLPRIAKYYRKGQAVRLLQNAGLADVQAFPVNKNSWTVIGTKP